ncbi:MAG: hypothetical protein WBE70_17230, partial [Candidatus Acidiferrum sp.]|jgi:hypothetical protein
MFNPKTHFAQVPLEVVKKIVEEQVRMEPASEPHQGINKETLSEVLLESEGRSIAPPVTLARVESSN